MRRANAPLNCATTTPCTTTSTEHEHVQHHFRWHQRRMRNKDRERLAALRDVKSKLMLEVTCKQG